MPLKLIILIVVGFVVSQVIGHRIRRVQKQTQKESLIDLIRRKQEEAQRGGQRPAESPIKALWEFGQAKQTPTSKEETKVEMPVERPRKADDEYQALVDESAPDEEEAFKVAQTQPSERRGPAPRARTEPPAPLRHGPVKIAGIPLTSQTISQGIIISEILRRPEF